MNGYLNSLNLMTENVACCTSLGNTLCCAFRDQIQGRMSFDRTEQFWYRTIHLTHNFRLQKYIMMVEV